VTSTSGFGDDLLHFVDLGLGAADCAESLLGDLPGTLVLRVSQQFDNAALIGSETGNLLDDFADKGSAAGETALAAADAGLGLDRGGFL
jgi:hypothetical protein